MNELEFQNLLTELKRSCNCAFLCDMPAEKDILKAATQIYIEQMRIGVENKRANVDDLINQLIDRIDIDVSRYEANIALTHDSDFDNHCDLCNDAVFTSIHNIIRAYRRGNNE